eukprot:TRINITY_DN31179_c0_g1_i2.p2 TRINITY_DN31179_c0_g1~~TRINITY_DN31179_c0_g1_i2.p2  ORF type:complete len:129 (+),score=7.88 TRINITY_DN31179_c0_g1_i2:68-454(+)
MGSRGSTPQQPAAPPGGFEDDSALGAEGSGVQEPDYKPPFDRERFLPEKFASREALRIASQPPPPSGEEIDAARVRCMQRCVTDHPNDPRSEAQCRVNCSRAAKQPWGTETASRTARRPDRRVPRRLS